MYKTKQQQKILPQVQEIHESREVQVVRWDPDSERENIKIKDNNNQVYHNFITICNTILRLLITQQGLLGTILVTFVRIHAF